MKRILALLLTMALGLGIAAIALFALDDRTTFTSPPQAVVEGFMREAVAARFERALPYLSDSLEQRVSTAMLEQEVACLHEEIGEILDIEGEAETIEGKHATASVRIKTGEQGIRRMEFHLVIDQGVWSISDIGPFQRGEME